jgi:hypothetical protein
MWKWRRPRTPRAAAGRWDRHGEITRLELELCRAEPEKPVDVPDGLLAKFGRDRPESRKLTPELREVVAQARDRGNWQDAVPVFREVLAAQPDYDVPYLWLANFLNDSGHTDSAIMLLKHAAQRCRRRNFLLLQAAEFALSRGDVRGSFHLCAQSIAAMPRLSGPHDVGQQRAFLFIAELFEVFGDAAGAEWARRAQDVTCFDDAFAQGIRDSAARVGEPDRSVLMAEVPAISARLRNLLPV